MKLQYTDGCTYTSLEVDGKQTVDLSMKEFREVLYKMIDHIDDTAVLQSIWMNIMETMGEYKDLGHCETCGDYISEYTWKI